LDEDENGDVRTKFKASYCVAGETRVIDPRTLRPTPIEELAGCTGTYTFDFEQNQCIPTQCTWFESGVKPLLKVYLGSGTHLKLTAEHGVFEMRRGWIPVGDLRSGDKILAATSIPIFGQDRPTDEQIAQDIATSFEQERFIDSIFKYSKGSLQRFARLLWDGHGRAFCHGYSLGFMVFNRCMALDLHHFLHRLEIDSHLDTEDYCVFVDDAIDRNRLLNYMGYDVPILEVRSPRRWEIVTMVTQEHADKVYDLSVDHPDHNFLAEDVVVHNCQREIMGSPQKNTWVCVHRRGGKTYCMTLLALFFAVTRRGKKIVVFAPSTPQIIQFFENLDAWIEANPRLFTLDPTKPNRTTPYHQRSFMSGSIIVGHITGSKEGVAENKRGITADYVFVDEAQKLKKSDWAVVLPIISGDIYRRKRGGVKTFIAGTIVEADGHFYKKIFALGDEVHGPQDNVVLIPITENPEYTEEQRLQIRAETTATAWTTEFLLSVGDTDNTIFTSRDVQQASQFCWPLGTEMINRDPLRHGAPIEAVRYVGVDWDKYGTGTHIVVLQYEPATRHMNTIYMFEQPKGPFTYTEAVNTLVNIWLEFKPQLIIADKGAGEAQWEMTYNSAFERGLPDMAESLIWLPMNRKLTVNDPSTMEDQRKSVKPLLVEFIRQKLQERKWYFPTNPLDRMDPGKQLEMELLGFKRLREVDKETSATDTIRYKDGKDHWIAAHMFAAYGVYTQFEDFLSGSPDHFRTHVVGVEQMSFEWERDEFTSLWGQTGFNEPGGGRGRQILNPGNVYRNDFGVGAGGRAEISGHSYGNSRRRAFNEF
jgi:hypothetical protein